MKRMEAEASRQDDPTKKTDGISLFQWVIACSFCSQCEPSDHGKNLKLSQIHFGCFKLKKLIQPRLLSVNRKLWSKKSLYLYLQPHFSGKLYSAVQKQVEKALTNELDFGSLVICFAG